MLRTARASATFKRAPSSENDTTTAAGPGLNRRRPPAGERVGGGEPPGPFEKRLQRAWRPVSPSRS
eukprot:8644345-Alexandrium_andersonii.AAC.1